MTEDNLSSQLMTTPGLVCLKKLLTLPFLKHSSAASISSNKPLGICKEKIHLQKTKKENQSISSKPPSLLEFPKDVAKPRGLSSKSAKFDKSA